MAVQDKFQIGVKAETTYGTKVTVDRFFEGQEAIKYNYGRVQSRGMRTGSRVPRNDRFFPYKIGGGGPLTIPVLTKGFGFWLDQMMGSVATTGPTDVKYTHTGTFGSLYGKKFTTQVNRPFNPANTDQAFTYAGCKVASWEFNLALDEELYATIDIDCQDEDTATALAVASFPSPAEIFSFVGGAVTVGGSAFEISGITVGCDNMLKTENSKIKNTSLKNEPPENEYRRVYWTLREADFADLTQFNRVKSATAAGALATIVLTCATPTLIGTTSTPSFVLTVDEGRFDTIEGHQATKEGVLMQTLTGVGLFDGSTSPVTIAYGTADTTP